MRSTLKILLVLLMAVSSVAHAGSEILSIAGYGEIRLGMPIAEAENAVGEPTKEPHRGDDCHFVEFNKYPGVEFMVENSKVVRADTRKNIKNTFDVQMGMPIAKFKKKYPKERLEFWDIDGSSAMHVLKTPDQRAAFVLFTVDGKVVAMWSGTAPAYGYYEGCV